MAIVYEVLKIMFDIFYLIISLCLENWFISFKIKALEKHISNKFQYKSYLDISLYYLVTQKLFKILVLFLDTSFT